MHYYTLADVVSRLRVASAQHLKSIKVIKTKFSLELLHKFYEIGFIRGFYVFEKDDIVLVYLKYYKNKSGFYKIELVSTPGRRVYWSLNFLSNKYAREGLGGYYIVSTPQGLKTCSECLLNKYVSGEVILKLKV